MRKRDIDRLLEQAVAAALGVETKRTAAKATPRRLLTHRDRKAATEHRAAA